MRITPRFCVVSRVFPVLFLFLGLLGSGFLFSGCQGPSSRPSINPARPGSPGSPGSRPDQSLPGKNALHTGDEPIDRKAEKLILTRHARCRMDCRHITEKEIREILENGEIDYRKSEPNGHPDPKYALEGRTAEGQHLRIVFAVPSGNRGAGSALIVVTCIELGVEWQCDCH